MRKQILAILAALLCLLLSACGHEHTWQPASCTSSQICTDCGETAGEALGHKWVSASCTESRFCSVCGLTSGEPLGHMWIEANCVEAMRCESCGVTTGEPNGHIWTEATCVNAETCSVCGETQGDPVGHNVEEWLIDIDSTCTEAGTEKGRCTTCGEECSQGILKKEHNAGEWVVLEQPTPDENGLRAKYCTACNFEMEQEEFALSEEEVEDFYKKNCKAIAYATLARTPGEYEGEYVKFSGYVVQICYEAESVMYYSTYRVATSGRYNDVVYIKVDNYGSGTRILEDDYITFYGKFDGLYTYETVRGDHLTIPCVTVEYYK